MSSTDPSGLYLAIISLHGLIRGEDLELGRDADTGGQTKYVIELCRALAASEGVSRVDLLTRLIDDPSVDDDYRQPEERIADNAWIVRIPFGPAKYLRKEMLWDWLGFFVDHSLSHFSKIKRTPDVVHAHYADAGFVGADLASLLNVPMVFTGHSLGHDKRRRLLDDGMSEAQIESRFDMARRIEAEEKSLMNAALVVASTNQEVQQQYAAYDNYRKTRMAVIPPGVDLERFRPSRRHETRPPIHQRIARFFERPERPWVLAISRPDERKNIRTLVDAYAESEELQDTANLVVVAGSRDRIDEMEKGPRDVITDLLLRIDRHNLYGKIAYPKRHEPDEVPDIYRLAARTHGVFINPALTEPFGLTLLEAAASGLPLVATDDGGPRDIIAACKNGILVDPLDKQAIAKALLTILRDRKVWRRMSAAGRRNAYKTYSWEGHARRYLRQVRKIVGRPKRRRTVAMKTRLPAVDRLLVTDIDNTLLGDEEAMREFFARLAEYGEGAAFGVATGRRLQSAIEALREHGAPQPDFYITSVGSEIHYGKELTPDDHWSSNIDYRWDAAKIREALRDAPGLKLQPKVDQRRYKVSYFIDPRKSPTVREIERLLRRMEVRGNVIFSHGQYLDILPVRASKGLAVRHLAHRWGIPMERVLVAGDSGNDAEMLTGSSLGLVVSNYSEELERLRGQDRVYFAEKPNAWGIIEGIEHYEFFGEIRVPQAVS